MRDCHPGACSPRSSTVPVDARRGAGALDEGELIERLRALLLIEGGFTVDLHTARSVRLGLAVCADPTRTVRFRWHEWSDRRVLGWLRDSRRFVRERSRPDLHLGGWHAANSDHVYLDLVRVVPADQSQVAESIGRQHRQHALFDLARRALLPLGAT